MTAHCNLNDADYRAFRRHVMFRYRKVHWLYGGMLALILLLTWLGGRPEETDHEADDVPASKERFEEEDHGRIPAPRPQGLTRTSGACITRRREDGGAA